MTTTNSEKVTVSPAVFSLVKYDADVIADLARGLATELGVANPISIEVDEKTPLAKMSAVVERADDGTVSSDSIITIRMESGALEDTQRFTNFSESHARLSVARMLLRARDRMRPDFADVPDDIDLTVAQNAAWDAYIAGRLARAGLDPVEQRFRYNYRNRFGFTDEADAAFERLWSADDLGWADLFTDQPD